MKRFVSCLAALAVFLFAQNACAAPDNFAGVKFDSTASQNSALTKLGDDFRPVPDLQFYRTDNVQIAGQDIGSVYFSFDKASGKFSSADFMMQFFDTAKRSKAIRKQDGSYMFMGQTSIAKEYFETLCKYFEDNYGPYQTKDNVNPSSEYSREARWDVKLPSCSILISITESRPKGAPLSLINGVIVRTD